MQNLKNILPITTVKRQLPHLIQQMATNSDPVIITKDGKAAAVILNVDDYESLMESLEILQDPAMMRTIKKAQAEFKAGRTYTHEQVFAE